jgi:thiol-disulfide isomerase/thioredoxin
MIISIRFIFLALIISSTAFSQTINQIKLKDLEKILTTKTERIQVINFWATWCAPCVKEIPLFEKLKTDNSNVDITLVSMDFDLDPDPAKVERFVTRKNLKNKVVILAETDPNSWIDKIDKNWGGALPATLVVNTQTGKRKLVQKELHEGDLEKLITEVTN